MDLNEAIKHFEEKAKELRTEAEQLRDIGELMSSPKQPYNVPVKICRDCANCHEQLAEWLEELKTLRRACDLACEELSALSCCEGYIEHDCVKDCETHWKEYFMKKAKIENDQCRKV